MWSYVAFAPAKTTSQTPLAGTGTGGGMGQLKQIARSYTQPSQTTATNSRGYAYGTYGGAGYGTGTAYTRSSTTSSTSSTSGYGNGTGYGNGYTAAMYSPTVSTAAGAVGMERPLPPRSGGYSHRPRSMDLVTPFSAGGY